MATNCLPPTLFPITLEQAISGAVKGRVKHEIGNGRSVGARRGQVVVHRRSVRSPLVTLLLIRKTKRFQLRLRARAREEHSPKPCRVLVMHSPQVPLFTPLHVPSCFRRQGCSAPTHSYWWAAWGHSSRRRVTVAGSLTLSNSIWAGSVSSLVLVQVAGERVVSLCSWRQQLSVKRSATEKWGREKSTTVKCSIKCETGKITPSVLGYVELLLSKACMR